MGPSPAMIPTPPTCLAWPRRVPVGPRPWSGLLRPAVNIARPVPYRPVTPPSEASSPAQDSPEYISQRDMSDVDYNEEPGSAERAAPKKGGYDSRVEQWLYENAESPILITYAGKNLEGGGSYIAYTINTGVWCMTNHGDAFD